MSRKDDVLGIGYQANVSETWSAQSVGFASVLSRLASAKRSREEENEEEAEAPEPVAEGAVPFSGSRQRLYAKRSRLKTEALSNDAGSRELMGEAALAKGAGRARADVTSDQHSVASTILQRLCVRSKRHEATLPSTEDNKPPYDVFYPTPKPPKATSSPFTHLHGPALTA